MSQVTDFFRQQAESVSQLSAIGLYTFIYLTIGPGIGGGVGSLGQLLPRVQRWTRELINGYVHSPVILENIKGCIVHPVLGNLAGVLGALVFSQESLQRRS